MVNRVHWVLWGRDGADWDPQWDQLGAVGSGPGGLGSIGCCGVGTGGLGWSEGLVGCCGLRLGTRIPNGIGWVLWGQDWWDWDHEWGQLGAMGSGLGGLEMVSRVHWVLWGQDWGELGWSMGLVGCRGVRTGDWDGQ